jgi:uncharacterized SAM-binding protein YcdF (DUF218 family)
MFFVLQKIIWFLILPPASLLVLFAAGLFIPHNRYRRTGRILIAAGITFLYLLSLGHVADLILRPLERAHPPLRSENIAADAVVVPGGGSVDLAWLGTESLPNAETLARLVKGVELAEKLGIPLVLTGGNGEPFSTDLNDADVMKQAALRMGVPARQLKAENKSRNTVENAQEVRKLVKGNRIILATSAYYMGRAVTLFERQGFTVIPAPVYYLGQSRRCNPTSLIPSASALRRSTTGIAEWISVAWWSMRGEI